MAIDYRFDALALALAGALALGATPCQAQAQAAPRSSQVSLDLRLRSEWVDDQAFERDAQANTLRARLGWRLTLPGHWQAMLEIEHNGHFGGESYNSTSNGQPGFPTIADPDNTELEQAWLAWSPSSSTRLGLGRQRLNYDNQRFVGAVGWRQNGQTFDAVDFSHKGARGWTLRYSYLDRVQRVFGEWHPNPLLGHWQLDAHLLSVAHALGPGSLTAYAHLIDNQDLPSSSHRNLGLRYALRREREESLGWFATLEAAKQDDHADGASLIDAHYQLVEAGLLWRGHTLKAGWEVLSGDGQYGFQTPLATLHAFNGWADKFLTTPADGLDDRYLGWNRKFGRVEAIVAWHDYRADHGGRDLGSEWNASLGFAPAEHWRVLAKAADYRAGPGGIDLRKAWLSIEYTH